MANILAGLFSNLGNDASVRNKYIQNLTSKSLRSNKDYLADLRGLGDDPTEEAIKGVQAKYINEATPSAKAVDAAFADPFKQGSGNAGNILKAYIGAHPVKTAATAGLGLANLSGLTDNDYYGGQLAGLAAGGLGSAFLGGRFNPMLTMAGGALGSLFDKLRQRQAENNRQSQYQY